MLALGAWCAGAGVCRCKQALLELRHLKSEAREATKLLEDKKVLEVKVRGVAPPVSLLPNPAPGPVC